jgi:hypothetical protein
VILDREQSGSSFSIEGTDEFSLRPSPYFWAVIHCISDQLPLCRLRFPRIRIRQVMPHLVTRLREQAIWIRLVFSMDEAERALPFLKGDVSMEA